MLKKTAIPVTIAAPKGYRFLKRYSNTGLDQAEPVKRGDLRFYAPSSNWANFSEADDRIGIWESVTKEEIDDGQYYDYLYIRKKGK
jgi:hypothetical protein